MAIAFVRQSGGNATTTSSTNALTITAPTNGDALVLFIGFANLSDDVLSISQTGATWNQLINSSGNGWTQLWVALNVSGAGATVTITSNASAVNFAWVIAEFSGVASASASDGAGASNSGRSTSPSTGAFSTTNANDVLLVMWNGETSTAPSANPSGFTSLTFQTDGSTVGMQANYKIVSSTQSSINPNWTTGNTFYDALGFALKAAAGGASFVPRPNKPILQAVNRASTY